MRTFVGKQTWANTFAPAGKQARLWASTFVSLIVDGLLEDN